ncbi:predicted protein [Sclerotinia sclerotiorum 1980 UF-70]|uniref:Uncharacterized protein n=1 Tax=Sclerotinia sclerotiorum (strain ATCC 18683 / 1980 / Ss-1) TaxID=665079 RepID=A7EG48_SCLS1|nr:predicted protein [Sclerotinia sclerotiorum 1980 UF-70]EDO01814.1 predicted protein [Sclerotinia sclerotiorum 1980 UF-70]
MAERADVPRSHEVLSTEPKGLDAYSICIAMGYRKGFWYEYCSSTLEITPMSSKYMEQSDRKKK